MQDIKHAVHCAIVFISELKKRYNWTDAEYEQEWLSARSSPNAIWAKDEYNEDIVSLLKKTTAASSRSLSHTKARVSIAMSCYIHGFK